MEPNRKSWDDIDDLATGRFMAYGAIALSVFAGISAFLGRNSVAVDLMLYAVVLALLSIRCELVNSRH